MRFPCTYMYSTKKSTCQFISKKKYKAPILFNDYTNTYIVLYVLVLAKYLTIGKCLHFSEFYFGV